MQYVYYRAKRSWARYKLSVRLYVRLSVTLVDVDHTRGNSSKIILRLISFLGAWLSADPITSRIYSTGNNPNFSRNRSGEGKIVDFRHLSRRNSETVRDRVHRQYRAPLGFTRYENVLCELGISDT